MTSAVLRPLAAHVTHRIPGFSSASRFSTQTYPVHLIGSPSLPRPPIAHNELLRCRNVQPACHRLRLSRPRLRTRLTLGRLTVPRNPQAFGVSGSHRHDATHSGILTSARSTSSFDLASLPAERSPTNPLSIERKFHSFGESLEPRYVVGATTLDQ